MSTKNENQDSMTIDATLTTDAGVKVPVQLEISWPEDYGLHALQYLHHLPSQIDAIGAALLQQLIRAGDASVLAAGARLDGEEAAK